MTFLTFTRETDDVEVVVALKYITHFYSNYGRVGAVVCMNNDTLIVNETVDQIKEAMRRICE